MKLSSAHAILIFCASLFLTACNQPVEKVAPAEKENTLPSVEHPKWSADASIYEVNIRQYTPEGTINAFREKMPRLQELGTEILWIMPVQPIGELNRKGGLGSYYSIQNYTAINPEFGTMEDFKAMVSEAHALGMKVILDWVANHTAWDAEWMEAHPEWYTQNDSGEVVAPVEDWSDVADLNYDNADMRQAMLDAMKFWVQEADIDGYRCDVAMMVPMDFWNETRKELDAIKPVFMLAEAEGPEFHTEAFDMTYGWGLHHIMNQVAEELESPKAFTEYAAKQDSTYPEDAIRMYFTTNHDENSWNGTVYERMGENHRNFFVFAATFPKGMPLIYSGQEGGLNKRLAFFEKDTILWNDSSLFSFYQQVIKLKKTHPALVNGSKAGDFEPYPTAAESPVYAYTRSAGGKKLLVALNLSGTTQDLAFDGEVPVEGFKNLIGGGHTKPANGMFRISAYEYLVLEIK
jgi:glycosidase